jgi:ribosomal protein S27E
MGKISDITENQPHEVMTAICPHCMHPWVAVFPKDTRELECPVCGEASNVPEQQPVVLLKTSKHS